MADTQTVTINNKEYAVESLSENARALVNNLRITDDEIRSLQQRLAITQTARTAYANALMAELPKD